MLNKQIGRALYYKGLTGLYNLKLTRHMMLAGAGLSLAAIALTAIFPKGTPPLQAAVNEPEQAQPVSNAAAFDSLVAQYQTGAPHVPLTLKSGESLGPLLQKNGVSGRVAYKVTQALKEVYDPRDLRAGQAINLYFGESQTGDQAQELVGVSFKPNIERAVHINRSGDDFAARDIAITFPMEMVQVSGTIENSLYLDAGAMGVPDKVTVQFSHIYEHSVDFQRDIRAGDAFTMAFELYRDARGNPVKAGNLIYTSFSPRGKTMDYWLYENEAGQENYYDADGKGAKRKLMRTPINGARLSSSYGSRRHPVLGYTRKHNGVDFAAPSGTPIMAAGVGRVERANVYGSFGNYIRISHSDGYKTAYAHLKSFARGIKAGARVTQGQIIGYVGTTGRSTGPHLHYEVHKNSKAINPQSLSTLSGKPLPSGETALFQARRDTIDTERKTARSVVITPPKPETVQSVSLEAPNTIAP